MRSGIQNRKGFTLVEVIVTFALTMIFLTACALSMSSYLKVYTHVNDMSISQTLADTLQETVEGSLGSALESAPSGMSSAVTILDNDGAGDKITYRNQDGVTMEIYAQDGRLVLHYLPTLDSNQTTVLSPEVYWQYKDGVYMDNALNSIAFASAGGNRVRVTLTLDNSVTGYQFTSEHTVECANLGAGDVEGG